MPTTTPAHPKDHDALAQARPELLALPGATLRPINLDVMSVTIRALGVLPAVRQLRPVIVAELGERHAKPIDQLEPYAHALRLAHASYLVDAVQTSLPSSLRDVADTRAVLLADARALVARKRLERRVLGQLRGGAGYSDQLSDLLQLIAVFRQHWADVEAVTPLEVADLDAAGRVAQRFLEALGARARGAPSDAASADLRQRAYTKVVDVYGRVRRAVIFVRHEEGDADGIIPSLWAGRGRRRSAGTNALEPSAPVPSSTTLPAEVPAHP
jgi:hypothetical protein